MITPERRAELLSKFNGRVFKEQGVSPTEEMGNIDGITGRSSPKKAMQYAPIGKRELYDTSPIYHAEAPKEKVDDGISVLDAAKFKEQTGIDLKSRKPKKPDWAHNPITENPVVQTIADLPSDIREAGKQIGESIVERGRNVRESWDAYMKDEQGELRTLWQTTGQIIGGLGGAIGTMFGLAGKAILDQDSEEMVKNLAARGLQKVFSIKDPETGMTYGDAFQEILKEYEKLKKTDPALARDISAGVGLAEFVAGVAGLRSVPVMAQSVKSGFKKASEWAGKKKATEASSIGTTETPMAKATDTAESYTFGEKFAAARTEVTPEQLAALRRGSDVSSAFLEAEKRAVSGSGDTRGAKGVLMDRLRTTSNQIDKDLRAKDGIILREIKAKHANAVIDDELIKKAADEFATDIAGTKLELVLDAKTGKRNLRVEGGMSNILGDDGLREVQIAVDEFFNKTGKKKTFESMDSATRALDVLAEHDKVLENLEARTIIRMLAAKGRDIRKQYLEKNGFAEDALAYQKVAELKEMQSQMFDLSKKVVSGGKEFSLNSVLELAANRSPESKALYGRIKAYSDVGLDLEEDAIKAVLISKLVRRSDVDSLFGQGTSSLVGALVASKPYLLVSGLRFLRNILARFGGKPNEVRVAELLQESLGTKKTGQQLLNEVDIEIERLNKLYKEQEASAPKPTPKKERVINKDDSNAESSGQADQPPPPFPPSGVKSTQPQSNQGGTFGEMSKKRDDWMTTGGMNAETLLAKNKFWEKRAKEMIAAGTAKDMDHAWYIAKKNPTQFRKEFIESQVAKARNLPPVKKEVTLANGDKGMEIYKYKADANGNIKLEEKGTFDERTRVFSPENEAKRAAARKRMQESRTKKD